MDGPGKAVSRAYGTTVERYLQQLNDALVPLQRLRWAVALVLALLYALRVVKLKGFYLVTYALGIFFLQKLVAFLAPKSDAEVDGPSLPTRDSDEFRPFQRKLPEYKFWRAIVGGIMCAHAAACFRVLDVPVYWPILLAYWLLLFFVTMRKQVAHMMKHKYLPFTNAFKHRSAPSILTSSTSRHGTASSSRR